MGKQRLPLRAVDNGGCGIGVAIGGVAQANGLVAAESLVERACTCVRWGKWGGVGGGELEAGAGVGGM